MAGGGRQAGEMVGSPLGGAPIGGFGGQSMPNMGSGMANSTNSTTTQDIMGRGGNGMSFNQTMGQLGLLGMSGQQGGYGNFNRGYNPMPQQMDGGPQFYPFGGQQQHSGGSPQYANPYMQQMQQQPQQQQLSQLNQQMQGCPMASGGIASLPRKG